MFCHATRKPLNGRPKFALQMANLIQFDNDHDDPADLAIPSFKTEDPSSFLASGQPWTRRGPETESSSGLAFNWWSLNIEDPNMVVSILQ